MAVERSGTVRREGRLGVARPKEQPWMKVSNDDIHVRTELRSSGDKDFTQMINVPRHSMYAIYAYIDP